MDRYGRRRRTVIGTGLLVAVALVAWLAVMCLGLPVAHPPGTGGPAEIDSPN